MALTSSILALIPARGGSRRLPRKNVRLLAGRPLVAWSIEAARATSVISRTIVSTDDESIAAAARNAGAETPFLRSAELASDHAASVDVVLDALDFLAKHERYEPEWILLLQPTSPLRTAEDIDAAVRLQHVHSAQAVVGVTAVQHPLEIIRTLDDDGILHSFVGGAVPRRKSEALYQINGAIYMIEPKTLRATRTFEPEQTLGYVMPPERSIDIDTSFDFHIAELLLRERLVAT